MIFGDAVGWCEGIIKAVNTDARKIITRGEPANFFVYYPVDDDTSKHNLTLDGYSCTAPTTAGCCSSPLPEGALVVWVQVS